MAAIIRMVGVNYSYESSDDDTESEQTQALQGVSLEIEPGEFIAIVGRNGSGKSTLAKLINAILTPTSGEVWVDGINTKDEASIYAIRQIAGMVFQNPDNQIVATIVEEDVAFGPENLGVPPAEIRHRVDDALQEVGMSEYALHPPHLLSGGQKQRIAIAGVLAMHPKILILDESTAMLDPSGRQEVMESALRLNREKGMTVVLITHHMDEAVRAERVVVLEAGSIVLDGSNREVFAQVSRLRELGLDVPQVTSLAESLRGDGIMLRPDTLTVAEMVEQLCQLF